MFNIPNLVTIFMLLGILVMFISRFKSKEAVIGGIWAKHPNIKLIMHPGPYIPEASGLNIQMSIIIVVLADARENVSVVTGCKDG